MIQATLQIKTNFRQAPRGKTLAVVKGPSGKPILLCSLAPRFKQRKERGEPRGAKPLPKRSAAIAGGAIAPRFALFNSIAAETHFENVTNNVLLPNSPQLSFPSLYSDQRALGSVLLKCLRRNFDPRVRHKLLAPDAKLLGLRLAQACILKGIQTVDVVIQEYTLSAYLLLQGLRMGGVRFNRFRILQAVDSSQNLMGKQMDLGKRASPHLKHERATLKPWLLDVSPKEELLRTLTKSRLIKTLTRHTFWQARSLKYKMDKLLSRKSRRGDIREQLNFSQTQKEAVKKWRAFTNLGTLLSVRAKEQAVGRSGGRTKWGAIAPPTKFKTTKWGAIAPSTKFKTTKWGATAPPKSPRGTIVPHFVHAPPTAPRAVAPRFATPPKRGGTKWGTNEVGGDSLPIVPTFVGGGEAKKTGFAPPLYSVPSYRLDRSFAPFIPKSFSKKLSLSQKARSPAGGDSPPNKLKKRAAGFKPKRMSKLAGSKRKPQFAITQTRFIANIQNTLNNTIITITDRSGNTKLWCSSGSIGLKASRRSTNYAAQSVAEVVAKKCRKLGIRRVEARVQGVGYGKPSALKGLKIGGLLIRRIVDTTPKPHNGCRAPKQRRV